MRHMVLLLEMRTFLVLLFLVLMMMLGCRLIWVSELMERVYL